jgi:type I restriction enzyme M protein
MTDVKNHANLVWGIAELLRGDYKQADYGKVILPLVVIRRLDQALEQTKPKVVARSEQIRAQGIENVEPALVRVARQQFYNDSPLTLTQLLGDAPKLAINLRIYLRGFSALAREVVDKFDFDRQIDKLERSGLLYRVIARVCDVDLHPDRVSNLEMGYLFEELIRKFAEASNETAGEHFTPREVVRLMVNLLVDGDEDSLSDPGAIRSVFDCACGTGGMLSEAEAHIRALNPSAQVDLYGQELNEESFAICLADMLVKGQDATNIVFGNSLSEDGHAGEHFDYCIANPPFGVDWTKVESQVRTEHAERGFDGRFGPGLPRKSDGQLLFLMHLISKMRDPDKRGSRIAIVHNGSPLFTGAAGSGESEIRRYVIENDLLEAIVALLQHGNRVVRLAAVQPQERRAPREGPAHRRARQLREDAQIAGRETPRDQLRADRGDHAVARRVQRGRRAGEDRRRRVARVPNARRRAAAARPIRPGLRALATATRRQSVRQAQPRRP